MRPKVYSYVRFSSEKQSAGDSYRRQMDAAKAFCAENDLELVDSKDYLFFDRGRSAYKGQHLDDTGELARFLSYVEDGSVPAGSYLVVESLDRLSRERVKDALPRFLDLLNKGINVYTSTDKRLYTKDYNELDLIISIVAMSRAHEESKTKGGRVSSAWQTKQTKAREESRPLGKLCPYWLEFVDNAYQPIPARVEVVQRIFQLAQDGYGHRAIATRLNQDGIPAFSAGRKNASGSWANSSIAHILRSRSVLGEYQPHRFIDGKRQPHGEPIEGFFPAVISPDQFYSSQQAVSSRKLSSATKPSKNFNLWAGVAKCGCGAAMHISKRGSSRIIRCFNSIKGLCSAKPVPLLRSEEMFKEILAKVDSLSLVQDNSAKIKKQISVADGQIVEIEGRLKQLQDQLLTLGGSIPASVVSIMQKLESDLIVLRDHRESLKEDLARDKTLSKEEFFSRLDLVSYEGRARANSLLKMLGITVQIRNYKRTRKDAVVSYLVVQNGRMLFDYRDDPIFGLMFFALSLASLDTAEAQGDVFNAEEQRPQLIRLERNLAAAELERQHIRELKKSHTYRQIADMEGKSVREVKRILGVS